MKNRIRVLGFAVFSLLFTLTTLVYNTSAGVINDYDGDGRTDFIIRRLIGTGAQIPWYIDRSRDGFFATTWGFDYDFFADHITDRQALGDFDGDGKWDITVTRDGTSHPSMIWYVRNSSDGSMTARQWGITGDKAVPQDYDGDGTTDFAVYRGGWWYILRSTDGQFQAIQFGTGFDKPFTGGDFDGDHRDDIAVVRDEGIVRRLFIRYSATGWWREYHLGDAQFTHVVAGDYDGDGKADVAILNSIFWYWERSSDGALGGGIRFGYAGSSDNPAPGDYDGDGTTDIAVYRILSFAPGAQNYFYVLQSRDGFTGVHWGTARDYYPPLPSVVKGIGSIIQAFNENSPRNDGGQYPRRGREGKTLR
jgi:hypothetical protein